MDKISIIIPAYNAGRFLPLTIDSVLAQDLSDWELVIVDDGSKDDTAAIAEDYSRRDKRIRWFSQPNSGVSAARNNGLAQSNPAFPYVIFLDADDIWEPFALSTLRELLKGDRAAAGAHGVARLIDENGIEYKPGVLEEHLRGRASIQNYRAVKHPIDEPTTLDMLAWCNYIMTPGVLLLRRAALDRVGPFDKSCTPAEDWDMWLRLAITSHFAFTERCVLAYRRYEGSLASNKERLADAEECVRAKLAATPTLTPEQARMVRQTLCRHERDDALWRVRWAMETLSRGEIVPAAKQIRHALLRGLRVLRYRLSESYPAAAWVAPGRQVDPATTAASQKMLT